MSSVSSTSSSGGQKLRITGMASGLDVDATVKKMIEAEQTKVDKAQQDQDILEWKQAMYQDIIKDIKGLQSLFFDSGNIDKNILSSTNYAGFNVTGGDSSIATITPGVGAQTGTYKVSVGQVTSATVTNTLVGSSLTTKLTDINAGLTGSISLVLNVDGTSKNITLDNTTNDKTLGDLVNAINTQGAGSVIATFDGTTQKFSLATVNTGIDARLTIDAATTDSLSNVLGTLNEGTTRYGTGGLASKASVIGSNIVNNSSNGFSDAAHWSGTDIGFSINGGTAVKITLGTNATITDAVNDINNKINANSTLKGTVQAVISGGNIQFQALSDSSVKIDGATTSDVLDTDAGGELISLKDRVINPSTYTTLGDLGLADATDSFDITYNGTKTTISVKKTDKLSDIINNIATATSGEVIASFSQLTGKFMLQSASTGSSQSISIAKGTGTPVGTGKALTALGLADASNNVNATITQGNDAVVTITPPGGIATTVVKSTNNFNIDGVNYNLTGTGDSTVTVGSDSAKVYDKIKTFIDKYNEIVDKIQAKLLEKKSSSYKPLTDAQKEAMSDTQITAWETKAKVGLLRNDENLQNMLTSLKSAFTSGVSGVGFTIGRYSSNSIGIDTSKSYTNPAHIDITDAAKLKEAIAKNGDQIYKFFANVSASSDETTEFKENGVFARIKKIVENNVGLTNTSLNTAVLTKYANKQDDYTSYGISGTNTLPNQIYQKELLVKKLKESLSDKQEAYYLKFSRLETAMNNYSSQQSWLSQQLGS